MKTIHHIENSLKKEQAGQARSNRFYKEKLNATEIIRVNYDTPEGKKLQQKDIDLFAIIDGKEISISEKDRNVDYNDILIEFYSLYPEKRGWMDYSEAQILAYFTPTKIFWIDKLQLVNFYREHLQNLSVEEYFDKLYKTKSTRIAATFNILGKSEKVNFIAAYNRDYVTMSISVSFDLLKRAGVQFTKYDFR